jgi:fructoselysine-6-P-deglycase FrlB-like protein
MKLTIPVDDTVAEQARERARAMGKSLEQLVVEYIEQLADADQAARDVEDGPRLSREARNCWAHDWDRLSREAQDDSRGWKFDREEIPDRYEARRRTESGDS